MKRTFQRYAVCSVLGVLLLGGYPLYMGVRVVADMIRDGAVYYANYPKYLIPYTPIAVAMLVAVVLMPILLRVAKKSAQWIASAVGIATFLITELSLEKLVIITERAQTTVENWQMAMCYIPPDMVFRCWTPVDVLIGEYSPWFKLHFYMIAIVLVLTMVNTVYGFGKQIRTNDKTRQLPLLLQTVATAMFLFMCILACFTAFYRTGELLVSPLSACLMIAFFVLLGLVVGFYLASFFVHKQIALSVVVPGIVACVTTWLMYIGEMCLLSGHTYQLGQGELFRAPRLWTISVADSIVVLGTGILCTIILWGIHKKCSSQET